MKPKLTVRDLFWLVLVAACLCAWWMDHRSLVASRQHLENVIAEAPAKQQETNRKRRERSTKLFEASRR